MKRATYFDYITLLSKNDKKKTLDIIERTLHGWYTFVTSVLYYITVNCVLDETASPEYHPGDSSGDHQRHTAR